MLALAGCSGAIDTIQEELFESSATGVLGVVATEYGLVAVGNDDTGNVVVWVSEDGLSWDRVDHTDALAGVDVGDVTVFESEVLVVGTDSETAAGLVLSSGDGFDWSRNQTVARNLGPEAGIEMTRLLEDIATTGGWEPQGIAEVDGNLAMVGGTYGNATVFWYSPDATAWSLAEPLPVFDTDNEAIDVVAWSRGFLALGVDSDGEPEVWTSDTGQTWTLRSTEIEGHPTLAAATSDIAIVVTQTDTGTQVWRSLDAEPWTRQDAEALSSSRVDVVSSTSAGFVAVGVDSDGSRVVWSSSDGSKWASVAIHGNVSDSAVNDVVPLGSSFVVVGYDREMNKAAFWIVDEQHGWIRVQLDPAIASLE